MIVIILLGSVVIFETGMLAWVSNDNDGMRLKVKHYEELLKTIKESSREPRIKLLARKRFK